MTRLPRPRRLGSRLLLSYLAASLAAALTGLIALFLTPSLSYDRLMRQLMHPAAGATRAQMDALVASAVATAALPHLLLALAVVLLVGVAFSLFLSRAVDRSLRRVVGGTRRLAAGDYEARLPAEGIEEFGQLADHLNALASSLEEGQRVRRLATASVSHELRTPVTALRGYLDALRDGVLPWSDEVLGRMALAVERLERMAQDLSALSRAEAGPPADLVRETLAAGDVLAAAADAVRAAAADSGVELRVLAPPEKILLVADRIRLAEILENLLLNSLRHTPAGRGVTLSAAARGAHVELRVADEGSGIGLEDLSHVMEPFYRGAGGSAGHATRPGMGLGLAIARRLAEAMGGSLAIESEGPGCGTCATLTLPQAP